MWFGFVTVGTAATLVIIASLWDKFQTSPTITGLDADFREWDVPFPAVTLCPSHPVDTDRLEAFVNLSSSDRETGRDLAFTLSLLARSNYHNLETLSELKFINIPEMTLQEIIYEIALRCEELLNNCLWKGRPVSCCDNFKPTVSENGFCFTFNSKLDSNENEKPEYIYETDAFWSVMIKSQRVFENPIRIYIHPWNEESSANARPHHEWRGHIKTLSFSLKHTYTTENTRQLSIKQRKCVFSDEIKLKSAHNYSYSACMIECKMKTAMKLCRCVPYFNQQAGDFPHCHIKGHICLSHHARTLLDIGTCDCELGCDEMVYEVEKLSDTALSPRGTLEIGFVSWPMVRYKREVLFGWVDLLVSFGGIAGLFLGFSLLSGVEIVYYFTMRAICANLQGYEPAEDEEGVVIVKIKRGRKSRRKRTKVSPLPQIEEIKQEKCIILKQRKKSTPYIIPYLP